MNAHSSTTHPASPERFAEARAEALATLRAMLAAMLQVEPDALGLEQPIVETGLTSVELIDLIVRCQARYAIDLPAGSLARLTLASLADAVVAAAQREAAA
ncbi:acyl carrier protein [Burkholderia perseverans]|uniref:acyl carrier protein n=1 Tax=Burkholderia perseverans TaxID=2615214 RepID=UPI001FEDCBEF|nr:acyl carrier protein [Burkholderia perseverans]